MNDVHSASKRRGRADIAARGAAVAEQRANDTVDAVRNAMRKIELDIEANDGLYPYAGGEISTAEVLRRAGKSDTALQKPRHREFRDEVNAWVEEIRGKVRKGAKVVRRAVTERATAAEDELRMLRQRWVEAELEYVETASRVAVLEQRCALLEDENASLRLKATGANVVPIVRRTDQTD